jgi:hypothetical protein
MEPALPVFTPHPRALAEHGLHQVGLRVCLMVLILSGKGINPHKFTSFHDLILARLYHF